MKWNTIIRGSKITLENTQIMKSFNGEPRKVEAGNYYITGFWVDMMGLSKVNPYKGNDVVIQSKELTKFKGIT